MKSHPGTIKIMKIVFFLLTICGIISLTNLQALASEGTEVLMYKVKDIDGNDVGLSKYMGKVVMIVNVASKCGLTPQYEDLVALHTKYREKGFTILAFPANNFMGQEPGSNEAIKKFCRVNYNVEFDLFSKISVNGDDIAPIYKRLISKDQNGEFGGEIKWNFDKFIVGKNGRVVARFDPPVKPTDAEIVSVIEKELSR